ncbi:DUF6624 domain-containing protein [Flavobacterium artemisiae]|uniref:DUF6624 domain-containing protein n=1 Tax=Flavobacterium artemisiae TaxID=2126556 RepID=A0ABW4HEC6_9FLAO
MKKTITFFFIVMNCFLSPAQNYKEWIRKADSCYAKENYKTSVDYYEKAFKIEQKSAAHLYKASCSASMSSEKKKAFKWLNLAIDNGYKSIAYLQFDWDLKSLHSDKQWKKTIDHLQKKLDVLEVNYDKPLQKELLAIYTEDQGIRQEFMRVYKANGLTVNKKVDSIGKVMQFKDSINLIKVMKILDEKGWIGSDVVGAEASQTLYLVIQHADLVYQQKYLPMMREAVKKGNAKPANLAYLEDRVALREGGKQIYGSQIYTNPSTKKNFIAPLEDPDNVDKRRAEVGLGPLSDVALKSNIVWNVEEYKKELPELIELINKKKQ